MPTYTQTARIEAPSTDPLRVGKIDVSYVYMDENFKSLMFILPREDDSEARVREELGKAVEHAAGAGPKKIELP